MDENQLWFVETVSQSVSSRGPRRSAHHRLNGHTDGFAQLSNRNSRIRIIGASSLYRGVLRRLCHRYTWVRFMWRLVRVPRRRPLIDLDTRGSAVRSSEVCSSGSSWVGSVGYRPLQLQITRRSVIGVASSFRSCCGFPNFAPNPLSGLGRSINAIVVAAWLISSVAPAARDTAEPGRSSAHHKIMIHVSGDTNHNQRGRDVASPVRCGLRATAERASHGTLNTAVLHRKGF